MKTERMIGMKPQHTSFLTKPPDPGARLRRLPLAALTLIFVSALSLSGCPGSDSSSDPGDTSPPEFQSAVVIGDMLTITFNEALGFPLPAGLEADFTVRVTPVGGTEAARTVSSVSNGTPGDLMIELTLAPAVIGTDGVTVEYTANNSRRITDLSDNILANFAAQTVQNNTDDTDGDGVPNAADVDDDGDGLIEIHDLDMLNNVRNKLNGTAYNDGGGDNSTGCGGLNGITTCSGYELTRDLDFSSGSSYALGSINLNWRPNDRNPATATNPGWMPIGGNGNSFTVFTATFDGNDYTLTGLYVRVEPASGDAYAGLFGFSGSGAGIRNTGVVAAAVFASSSPRALAGGLVGFNDGGSISNSYATGSVSASSSAAAVAGGLVGGNGSSGSISNSYATGSVSASASSFAGAGGLVGSIVRGSSISNSYATGSVSASASGIIFASADAGGLVGLNIDGSSISNSYATGSVSASVSSSSPSPRSGPSPRAYAGGLVGDNDGSISNSYATGSASASASVSTSGFAYAGGLVGRNMVGFNAGDAEIIISNSYATGSASSSSNDRANAGGLVGLNGTRGSISNSYATGSASSSSSNDSAYVGGLVGVNIGGSISNSYATGSVSASASGTAGAGGLVGINEEDAAGNTGSISNSYATGSVSASASSFAGAGGLVGFDIAGSISNSYWDSGTVVLIEDGAIVSAEDQDIGNTGDHTEVTALSPSQMQAIRESDADDSTITFPDLADDDVHDFNLGNSSAYPLLVYGGTVDTDCKNPGTAGDLPVCGSLLPGQEVRMASGFLRFSNTAIGTPSSTDFVFFYDIEDAAIAISGTGVNGTTAGSYAIEDAVGTAPTLTLTGTMAMLSGLALSAGDEFYLRVTFTKDLNADGDTMDSGESFTQRYRFKK